MNRFFRTLASVFVLLAMVGPQLSAQEQGTIQATATVISALSVVGSHNLLFGTVTPGINKSVDKSTAADAGEYTVTGTPIAEITVDFSLPTNLYTADSLGVMLIAFGFSDGSFDDGTGGGQSAPVGILNPNAISTTNIGIGGVLRVWLGGMALPTISQTSGDYSGDVVLTVVYTGN